MGGRGGGQRGSDGGAPQGLARGVVGCDQAAKSVIAGAVCGDQHRPSLEKNSEFSVQARPSETPAAVRGLSKRRHEGGLAAETTAATAADGSRTL
jgi:hypothetical protein